MTAQRGPGVEAEPAPPGAGRVAPLAYRPDIDGLRAVAVVAVMLFHARVEPFSGGFAGVDVFFVISGFLITSILLRDLGTPSFSLAGFYERRIRRIFPALFVVLAVSGAIALLVLMPLDLAEFGASMASAASFASNIFFWDQVGYFDTPADSKPLLHTWSLAIEEQFYILFPLLLVLVRRFAGGRWAVLVVPALAASFLLSLATSFRAPAFAFYAAPTRAWELMTGALLASGVVPFPESRGSREAWAWTGLLLVLSSFLLIGPTTPFPGLAALAPCGGTLLLIGAGQRGRTVVGTALAVRPVVFVGLISYSLYLWHWPILVYLRYWLVRPLEVLETALALTAAVLLAALSWRFVEVPCRRTGSGVGRRTVFLGGGFAILATAAAGSAIYLAGGMPGRFPPGVVALLEQGEPEVRPGCHDLNPSDVRAGQVCAIGDPDAPVSFALWGDSHAAMFVAAFEEAAVQEGRRGLVVTHAGCAPGKGSRPALGSRMCEAFNDAALDLFARTASLERVFMAGYWRRQSTGSTWDEPDVHFVDDASRETSSDETTRVFQRSLGRAIDALGDGVVPVVIADPPEVAVDLPTLMARLTAFGRDLGAVPREVPASRYFETQARAFAVFDTLAETSDLEVIHLDAELCPAGVCPLLDEGGVLYRNGDHLSGRGAARLVATFQVALSR